MKPLQHKGYFGSVEFSEEDEILYGKLLQIKSLFLYEGETIHELKNAFISAADEYLEFCEEKGIEPEKSFSGKFNVRTGELRHKQVSISKNDDESLNEFVNIAIDHEIERRASA